MLLPSEDPAKVARANKANSIAYQPALEKIAGFDINWNIVAYPNPSWAKLVFPKRKTWRWQTGRCDLFAASRVDVDDPVGAWAAHNAGCAAHRMAERPEFSFAAFHRTRHRPDRRARRRPRMAGRRLDSRRTASPATQHPDRGVFTTPHARRVEGRVASTKPLSHQGTLIDGIEVRFEGGRIVEAKASRGEDVLQKVLDTDEGRARLGEVALVPHSSPISKSGLLFYNTLFDENAACHIALGQCYSKCFVDGAN
jgi:aminopeptidase